MMTIDELSQYREKGFSVIENPLSDIETNLVARECSMILDNLAQDEEPEFVDSIEERSDHLKKIFFTGPFVAIAEQIIGPDIALFMAHITSKSPGKSLRFDWHQDAYFFPISPMKTFTLWMSIDGSNEERGCVKALPGSHKNQEIYPHVETEWAHEGSGKSLLAKGIQGIDPNDTVNIELPYGGISLHDPYTIHGSGANVSASRRTGLVLRYMATDAKLDRSQISRTDWRKLKLYYLRGNRGTENSYTKWK